MPNGQIFRKKFFQKRVRLLWVASVLVLLILGSLGWLIYHSKMHDEFSMEYVSAREIPDFLQFTYYDRDEWVDKLGMEFTGALTYQKLSDLLDYLEIKEYITYQSKRDNARVSRDAWNQIYDQILGLLDTSGKVRKEKILVLGQSETGKLDTQNGIYQYSGVLAGNFHCYEVYVMEDKLLGILNEWEEELSVENAYVTRQDKNIEFLYQNSRYQIPLITDENIENMVCDIYMKNGNVTKIYTKKDVIEGKLLALEDASIEVEGYGNIERATRLPVYQVYGEVCEKSISDIVLGNMNISYIVAGKRVCAILLNEAPKIETVRVLLLNENQGIGREEVYFSISGSGRIRWGKKKRKCKTQKVYKASDYISADSKESLIVDNVENGKIYLCDANGTPTSPGYAGGFEIRKYEEGYVVVNVVSLEEYLCGVVPSEMPSTYPLEALKAQAVCARSYAGIQLLNGAYAKYGAHMDDSVSFQVYNKQEPQEITTQAVSETVGQVIALNGEIKEAYYYSTSYGHSGNYEAWNLENDGSFDYLCGTWLKEEESGLDISEESVFSEYIRNPDDTCYDSFAKYFRWNASVCLDENGEKLIEKIDARKKVKPESILIRSNENIENEQKQPEVDLTSASGFGKVLSVATEGRNSCGGVKKLVLIFEKGRVEICDEYTMRVVLGCVVDAITFHDGSSSDTVTVLPSSYFVISAGENGNYTLYGGGYGHGIGMSQNGAKGMAELGYTYDEILKKFYHGIELENISALKGEGE